MDATQVMVALARTVNDTNIYHAPIPLEMREAFPDTDAAYYSASKSNCCYKGIVDVILYTDVERADY